ncbi:hypothetical protein P378_15870 [Desulforamulus profundi]|uniref:Uncharacterized protein n=1 Tax=Desulforamulus profundi TaxID=1383067 RepID=A0A2C6MBH4_9FIRM|nr:hypothetical protein [Desulforamulus profundi]PHJ37398.1 hypothetical protein P378_15870 [Desulforamulus profundi]
MLAVSFFFVLAGGILLFVGIIGLFLNQLTRQHANQKKWLFLSSGGFISLLLGMLMAMT